MLFANLLAKKTPNLALMLVLLLCVALPTQALFVSPPKDPMPLIKAIFSEQTSISEKKNSQGRRSIIMDNLQR